VVSDDAWASLADQFADQAYASVKGYVRTYVLHQQLLEHLPPPPAPVLDVGGGAGHQSFPLAQAGYDVTVLDPSPAMLDKARQRLQRLPAQARRRVTLVQADGEHASAAVDGRRFAAVLCHGVLGYLEQPEPLVSQLCQCAAAGGVVSIMTGNARAMAVRPALERRWDDALAAFDARAEIGVLGVPGRPTPWKNSASSCGAGAWSPCAGTGYGCSSTGLSSAAPSWTPPMPSRSRPRPPSNSRPAGGTPIASSAASFISWDARTRTDRASAQQQEPPVSDPGPGWPRSAPMSRSAWMARS
jgi:S-adenosylmethionine-dependent methyltransferase